MRDLGRAHEEHLFLFLHGDHVPLAVLNAAVVAHWLPDFFRALSAKACDELKLRSFGPHVSVSVVSLLSMWPSVWQHTLGHMPSSCGPNTGIE